MKNKDLYPVNWPELSFQCRERAGWKCENCGVAHLSERLSRKSGKPYRVTLAACHRDHAQRWNPDAELLCLCEICHWWHDRMVSDWRLFRLACLLGRFFDTSKSEVGKDLPEQADRRTMIRDISTTASEHLRRFSDHEVSSLHFCALNCAVKDDIK